nr:hypothetical protein GCM10020093_008870 [Planobispora longispora]
MSAAGADEEEAGGDATVTGTAGEDVDALDVSEVSEVSESFERPESSEGPGVPEVVVAGAGPVGLTAALVLARRGVAATVLEAGEELSAESRASTFHPPTLEMLHDLGVLRPCWNAAWSRGPSSTATGAAACSPSWTWACWPGTRPTRSGCSASRAS